MTTMGASSRALTLDGLRLEEGERIVFMKKPAWDFWLFWGIMFITVVMIPVFFIALKARGKAIVLTNKRIIKYNGGSNPSFAFADLGKVDSKKGLFTGSMFCRLILHPREGSSASKMKIPYLSIMNGAPAVQGAILFWSTFPGVDVEHAPAIDESGQPMMPEGAVDVAIAPRVTFMMGETLNQGKGAVVITPNAIVAVEGKFEKQEGRRSTWGPDYPVGAWVLALSGVSSDVADFQARLKRFIEESKIRAEVIGKEKVTKVHAGMGQLQISSGKRIPFSLGMPKELRESLAAYAHGHGYPQK